MIKTLFIIGECIRALHTDPWQAPTFKVYNVGKYSYRIRQVCDMKTEDLYCSREFKVLEFENQKELGKVECPKEEEKP